MDVEAILAEIGGWGKYQKIMFLVICLPSIVAGAAVVSLSWTGYDMGHRCFVTGCDNATTDPYSEWFLNFTTPRQSDPDDDSLPWSKCQTYQRIDPTGLCEESNFNKSHKVDCTKWVLDTSVMEETIISEFHLNCGSEWLSTLASSLYMVGMLIGSIFFGYISDRWGRKVAMMAAFLFLGISGLVSAFSPNYSMFAVMRFLTGMGGMGTFMITFVIAVELVGNEVRTLCGIAIELWFSLGAGLVGVAAVGIKDWRILQIVITVPTFIFLTYWFIMPESHRWLASEGRNKEAEEILRKAAKTNGRPFPEALLRRPSKAISETASVVISSGLAKALFASPRLRWRTCIIIYQWVVTAMVYYGLALNATNLGGNVYVNFILVQLVDWPGIIFCILVLDPWGRKLTTCLCFTIAGIGSIASGLSDTLGGGEALTVGTALVGKFGAGSCFAIVFVYGAELFPTDCRNTGIGMASAAGRLGSICAPFIAGLGSDNQIVPMSIFGVLSLLAGAATLFLPETYGQNLPTSLEEAEAFGLDQTLCFVPCLVSRRKKRAVEPVERITFGEWNPPPQNSDLNSHPTEQNHH